MPETYKVTVSTQLGSALPADRMVNVLHFRHSLGGLLGTDLDSFATNILDAYDAQWFGTAAAPWREVVIYRTEGPPPHDPQARKSRGTATAVWSADYPTEIALCMSFRGGLRPWQRGRSYLSPQVATAWRGTTALASRPAQNIRDAVVNLGDALGDAGGPDWSWVVHSRTRGEDYPIDYVWCDDEWDIQRRRGRKPTTRSSRTINP
jgi:hypothetical protein